MQNSAGGKWILDDLAKMMFAFGDSIEPQGQSIDSLEQIAIGFIDALLRKVMERSASRGFHNKISKDDLLFVLKDNPKYTRRIAEILIKSQNVRNIKQQIEDKDI